ncbi:hypothetical protein JEQ12_013140 [Ovis aries]|uniref:Cytochrome c oxidase subunit 7C, mitochondrial n=1 Tax=Ovis aries TaxID=9940 RepID=A0A835ZRZ1_SHEEP|nr:hypothetical protein JEQ12_013140 [Ovis aries]
MLGQSIQGFTISVVRRSHYEGLLAMMTLFFGSEFAAPFFIVRHRLLKK